MLKRLEKYMNLITAVINFLTAMTILYKVQN